MMAQAKVLYSALQNSVWKPKHTQQPRMEEQNERALSSSGQNTTELEENGKSHCSHVKNYHTEATVLENGLSWKGS